MDGGGQRVSTPLDGTTLIDGGSGFTPGGSPRWVAPGWSTPGWTTCPGWIELFTDEPVEFKLSGTVHIELPDTVGIFLNESLGEPGGGAPAGVGVAGVGFVELGWNATRRNLPPWSITPGLPVVYSNGGLIEVPFLNG
jgi:hypothetical protein